MNENKGKIGRKIVVIMIGVVVLLCMNNVFYKSPIYLNEAEIDVEAKQTNVGVTVSYSNMKWSHSYEVKEKSVYISLYQLSYWNPFSKDEGIEYSFKIHKGYEDIEKIYLNGEGDSKILIWEKR